VTGSYSIFESSWQQDLAGGDPTKRRARAPPSAKPASDLDCSLNLRSFDSSVNGGAILLLQDMPVCPVGMFAPNLSLPLM
jgi:hypothetical protein